MCQMSDAFSRVALSPPRAQKKKKKIQKLFVTNNAENEIITHVNFICRGIIPLCPRTQKLEPHFMFL